MLIASVAVAEKSVPQTIGGLSFLFIGSAFSLLVETRLQWQKTFSFQLTDREKSTNRFAAIANYRAFLARHCVCQLLHLPLQENRVRPCVAMMIQRKNTQSQSS